MKFNWCKTIDSFLTIGFFLLFLIVSIFVVNFELQGFLFLLMLYAVSCIIWYVKTMLSRLIWVCLDNVYGWSAFKKDLKIGIGLAFASPIMWIVDFLELAEEEDIYHGNYC